jgi:hypothetical protein
MRGAFAYVGMALAAGFLAGCSDGLLGRGSLQRGTFEGSWDGDEWRGSAYAVLQNDSLTVVAHRPDPKYFYDEYVRIQVRFKGRGLYPVAESHGQLSKITGGDAGWMSPSAGTLVIDGYDESSHVVSGSLSLRAESMQPAWHASGRFDAPVYASFQQVPPEPR